MASKKLGALIQRAISDEAFRRQLQSDPAAALRGFNLTQDEIAAIRSGDSSKLVTLGVDQRMSKAFTAAGFLGASRSTVSDLSAGGSASALANDPTAGVREGIVGESTWGLRAALATGTTDGTRAVHDVAPYEGNVNGLADPTVAGTRSEPLAGDPTIDDNVAAAGAGRGGSLTGDMSGSASPEPVRAVNDVAPFDGNANAGAASGDEFLAGDARLDPGLDSSRDFVPSDSADMQRELLDHGNALGNIGGGGNTSS
jgi:hypothetical protein